MEAFADRLNYELDVILRFLGHQFDSAIGFATGHPMIAGIATALLFGGWLLSRQDPSRPD